MQEHRAVTSLSECTGYFDSFDDGVARGWAYDRHRPDAPLRLHVVIDGQEVTRILCDVYREDLVRNLGHASGRIGFEYQVPSEFIDGEPHEISFRLPNRETLGVFNPSDPEGVRGKMVFELQPYAIKGYVDGLRSGKLRGWVFREYRNGGGTRGQCQLSVTCNGREIAIARADRHRRDVASALGCDPNCGFEVIVPPALSRVTPHTFHFHVVPDGIEIGNSPITTTLVDDQLVASLAEVSELMDRLFRDFAHLRKQVDMLMPESPYSLNDYDTWAREYYRALTRRIRDRRVVRDDPPLVSVLIPAYRPLMSDFNAAVESVLAQTYANWELIIVDDASKSPELTAQIKAFCKRDARIRAVPRKKNGNISEATNTAIAAAKGEWIALFDHDDLLVDVALEVIVDAALKSGADYLYSDEDKIDQLGYFHEPNLKPDWNHRYMLGCNYACHLSFIRHETLTKVGPLRTAYNGSQDHDLLLRISEVVPEHRIHHVPEILYHWRMTPNSTAVSVDNKDYARNAGVKAVQHHLDRIGRPAKVSSINGLTIYRVEWEQTEKPSVCVIIPFREQIEITRRCLNSLVRHSDYKDLEILLVDNWSTSREAARFTAEAAAMPGVRVLRVEEPFNYARINNLAVATTDADILCFMNNDVLVDQGWLRAALGEMTDSTVGAVGGLFRYPNGKVQHAGVVVGPSGIAAHGHMGEDAEKDYGYIGQIKLSREVTAVTAAGLLVRHSVFDEVGGFDEKELAVAYNDVDLCLKIRAASYKIIYCAEFTAEHHESLSRGSDDRPEHEKRFFYENEVMRNRWGSHPLFERDPAYSRFLTVDRRPYYDLRAPDHSADP